MHIYEKTLQKSKLLSKLEKFFEHQDLFFAMAMAANPVYHSMMQIAKSVIIFIDFSQSLTLRF